MIGTWIKTARSDASDGGLHPADLALSETSPVAGSVDLVEDLIRSTSSGCILRVMSPVIEDPEIVKLLCDARRRGIIVKILTSLTDSSNGFVTRGWDESLDLPKRMEHHKAVRHLAKAGVLLRSPATTPHAKILQVENHFAWFGSANLTRNSLRGNAVEVGLRIDDPRLLDGFRAAFDFVWSTSIFSMKNQSGALNLSENRPGSRGGLRDSTQEWLAEGGINLLLSYPGGSSVMLEHLADALDQAQGEVILAAMSFYRTNEIPLLGDALERCLNRGVEIRTVVRPEHFKPESYPDPSTLKLIHSGMRLLGVTGLHAKGILIDGRWCGLQSANFNPYSLDPGCETANWELGLIGPANHPILREWASFVRHLADFPSHRFRPDEAFFGGS